MFRMYVGTLTASMKVTATCGALRELLASSVRALGGLMLFGV